MKKKRKQSRMMEHHLGGARRIGPRVGLDLAALSYQQVANVVLGKHGWKMSKQHVQQVCLQAERKLKIALEKIDERE